MFSDDACEPYATINGQVVDLNTEGGLSIAYIFHQIFSDYLWKAYRSNTPLPLTMSWECRKHHNGAEIAPILVCNKDISAAFNNIPCKTKNMEQFLSYAATVFAERLIISITTGAPMSGIMSSIPARYALHVYGTQATSN